MMLTVWEGWDIYKMQLEVSCYSNNDIKLDILMTEFIKKNYKLGNEFLF